MNLKVNGLIAFEHGLGRGRPVVDIGTKVARLSRVRSKDWYLEVGWS